MRSAFLIPIAVMTLAGCTSPRAAPPVVTVAPPPPRPVAPVPAPLAADWNDWPYTPGDWSYRRSDSGALATFGTADIMMRCDFARRTIMLRVDGGRGSVTVRTTTLTRTIPVATSANVTTDGSAMLPRPIRCSTRSHSAAAGSSSSGSACRRSWRRPRPKSAA